MKLNELKELHKILLLLAILLVWNVFFSVTGLFPKLWIGILLVDFVIVVLIFKQTSLLVPPQKLSLFEKMVAVSFPFILLGSWEALVHTGILNANWFPPPTKIVVAIWNLTIHYDPFTKTSLLGRPWLIPSVFMQEGLEGVKNLFLESHVFATVLRLIVGFVVGAIPGIIVGVFMGISRIVRTMLDPIISATYVVPKITILPLMMLIFDPFGETYQIVTVAIGVFFLALVNTMVGVRDIEPILIEAGKNFGASSSQLFRHVIIPAALPFIFAGLRLGLGVGLVLVVAIEFLRGEKGVGYITWYYWEIMIVENMYAGLIIIMTLGVVTTFGLQALERRLLPWRREEKSNQDSIQA
jgi:ABC-type nitrate/sulfonate/bicarbonate transport system permease component